MLINRDHKLFGKIVLRDCKGSAITVVKSFDTESKIAEIYILGRQDSKSTKIVMLPVEGKTNEWKPLTVHVALPGATLHYLDDNRLVPKEDL